jgi:hypothetical protein
MNKRKTQRIESGCESICGYLEDDGGCAASMTYRARCPRAIFEEKNFHEQNKDRLGLDEKRRELYDKLVAARDVRRIVLDRQRIREDAATWNSGCYLSTVINNPRIKWVRK